MGPAQCAVHCVRECLSQCNLVYEVQGSGPSQDCFLECTHNCIPQCNSQTMGRAQTTTNLNRGLVSSGKSGVSTALESGAGVQASRKGASNNEAFQILADLYNEGSGTDVNKDPLPTDESLDMFGNPAAISTGVAANKLIQPDLHAADLLKEPLQDTYLDPKVEGTSVGGAEQPTEPNNFASALANSMHGKSL